MTELELAPCPFCGSPAHIIEGHRNHFRAQCSKCGANIGEFFANRSIAEDRRLAAEAWNARPEAADKLEALSGRIAVLEGVLAALRPAVDEQEGRKAPTEAHIGCEHCEIEVTVPVDQDTCPLCGWPLWETE